MAHACEIGPQEAEVEGSGVQSQPGLYSAEPSQKQTWKCYLWYMRREGEGEEGESVLKWGKRAAKLQWRTVLNNEKMGERRNEGRRKRGGNGRGGEQKGEGKTMGLVPRSSSKNNAKPGLMVQAYNASPQESEAGGSQLRSVTELQRKFEASLCSLVQPCLRTKGRVKAGHVIQWWSACLACVSPRFNPSTVRKKESKRGYTCSCK